MEWLLRTSFVFVMLCCFQIRGQNVYFNVTEEQGNVSYIGNIADSAKLQTDNDLKFSLLNNGYPLASKFSLDVITSDLVTVESLDRDIICAFDEFCVLHLGVVAQSDLGDFINIKVFINLKDINDNSPVFSEDLVSFNVVEGTPVNTSFSLEGATDIDAGTFGITKYEIRSDVQLPFEAEMDTFTDGRATLKLVIVGKLDREQEASYRFQVLAYDGGVSPNVGSLIVGISITDVNDNYPTFTQGSYNTTIKDDSSVNTVISRVFASDLDEGENGLVKYRLSSLQTDEIKSTFSINATSGEVYLRQSLITRSKEYYRIIVEASDRAKQPLIAQTLVFVRVLDHHNNFPEININLLSNKPHAEIAEHASQGATVAHVAVSDPDTGDNGLVTCKLIGNIFKLQKFDKNEYKVVVFETLNREVDSAFDIVVQCRDTGNPPKITNSTFKVVILDENDNEPKFEQLLYYTTISENNDIGISLLKVTATDTDIGQNAQIEYTLQNDRNNNFFIDKQTGQINVNKVLDREEQSQYSFLVLGTDRGSPSLTGTGTVSIDINDVNDNKPQFQKDLYSFSVTENSAENTIIGEISAFDVDDKENSEITYSISTTIENEVPFIVVQNGSVLVSIPLDREKSERYYFRVVASDQGNPSLNSSAEVIIQVDDENDNRPSFVFPNKNNNTINISYKTLTNSVVAIIKAFDNDTGINSKLSFYLTNQNISKYLLLNSYNGELFLIKELSESDIGSLSFEVTIQDHGNPPLKSYHNLTLNITHPVSSIDSKLEKNIIIAIAISGITLFLALLIIFMIFLLRRQQAEHKNKLQESQESESQRTSEGQEAGFIKVVSPVYYPPTYTLQLPESYIGQSPPLSPPPSYTPPQLPEVYYNPPKYNTIQRSISVQVCVIYLRFMY